MLNYFIPLEADVAIFNAGTQCDMTVGPCACGAWHKATSLGAEPAYKAEAIENMLADIKGRP